MKIVTKIVTKRVVQMKIHLFIAAEAIDNYLEDNVQIKPNAINQQFELELKQCRNEKYLALKKKLPSKHYDGPLAWRKQHANAFSTLVGLEQRNIAIEAASTASESIFSKAQIIKTSDRSRLKPEIIGSLLHISTNLESYEKHIEESHHDEIYGQNHMEDNDHDEENDEN